ncbi:MAG TPA: ATP-binding protein [Polyangiaceae bacterium]
MQPANRVAQGAGEQREAEEELRESEQRFRLLVESVADYAIFMLDPSGVVTTWNTGAQRIKGYRAEEIVGQHFSRFYPPDDVRAGKCEMELEGAAREGRYEDEGWRVRKDGTRFWANVVITALRDDTGRLVGFAKVTRDLTERKRAEEERLGLAEQAAALKAEQAARKAADDANRAKDEFVAMVSHELRTPLNAIMGWAKLMASPGFDETRRGRAVETVERNAVAMAQLIEDLLDMSRIISGKMRLEVQSVDVGHALDGAVEVVQQSADAKGVVLAKSFDGDIPLVAGDPTRLKQVVWNLLSNAVKFTPRGGRVDVKLRTNGPWIEIAVSDTGKGIRAGFLPHIFDAFRQDDVASAKQRGGLGLGLAITRQLVELHGGRIDVLSEGEGRGATFTVFLPVADSTRSEASARRDSQTSPSQRPSQLSGLRVLVVDDDEDMRDLVRTVLEDCGSVVTTTSSVADALEALARSVPDVVLSDIGMPNRDGYDLIRQVRALPPDRGGNVPAAAFTGFARAEDRRDVLNAGYSMHITKPIDPTELMAVVASLTRFAARRSSP